MTSYLVRYYWREENNPDNVKITLDRVKAKDESDAYDKSDPYNTEAPQGFVLLNWVVFN